MREIPTANNSNLFRILFVIVVNNLIICVNNVIVMGSLLLTAVFNGCGAVGFVPHYIRTKLFTKLSERQP